MIVRRARPLLGTLVEVGVVGCGAEATRLADAAFAAIATVQARLSRFEPGSDVARFNELAAGQALDDASDDACAVLHAAAGLRAHSEGLFDVSIGSAPDGWRLVDRRLEKLEAGARLDLGGIGKGHAVDRAIDALRAHGAAAGWVNAGGDVRVFGDLALPIVLRDEAGGGARPCATLRDGAFATSCFDRQARSSLAGGRARAAHLSVAAPTALLADALTKIIALTGDTRHALLERHGARALVHGARAPAHGGRTAEAAAA